MLHSQHARRQAPCAAASRTAHLAAARSCCCPTPGDQQPLQPPMLPAEPAQAAFATHAHQQQLLPPVALPCFTRGAAAAAAAAAAAEGGDVMDAAQTGWSFSWHDTAGVGRAHPRRAAAASPAAERPCPGCCHISLPSMGCCWGKASGAAAPCGACWVCMLLTPRPAPSMMKEL